MDLKQSFNLFLDFVRTELRGKGGYYTGWIKINGDRICNECPHHKRRSLYILMKEGNLPFLKCFRISCTIKRYITKADFLSFGFTNMEAIKCLLEDSISYNAKSEKDIGSTVPLVISDYTLSKDQADYFEARTNIYPDYETIEEYRIIPNIYKAIYETYDDVETHMRFEETKIRENKYNITFATQNYNMFFYRDIHASDIKLKFSVGNTEPYTLGDSDSPEYMVIAEGVFDLINIYSKYAVIDKAIYIATGGAQAIFNEICDYYTKHIESIKYLIIFADSDISLGNNKYTYDKKFYDNLFYKLNKTLGKDVFKEIYLVYNKASKDFGDMREEILPEKLQIK